MPTPLGHTSFGFMVSHSLGLSVDASIIMGVASNINDLLPLAVDGKDKWANLYKILHNPDKSVVAHLWALYGMMILLPFMIGHWFLDKLAHKKGGGKNWAYHYIDVSLFIGNLIYCYFNFWR